MGKARLLSASRRSIKERRRQTPDDVFSRYSKKVSDLQIDMIDEDLILIEGSAATFRFLAELFGAMADDAIAGVYSASMLCAWPWLEARF